jgi:hypothetical protein
VRVQALLAMFDGVRPVLVGVGLDNIVVEGFRGVDVVVVGIGAGFLERLGLTFLEDAQARAHLDFRDSRP